MEHEDFCLKVVCCPYEKCICSPSPEKAIEHKKKWCSSEGSDCTFMEKRCPYYNPDCPKCSPSPESTDTLEERFTKLVTVDMAPLFKKLAEE